MSELPAESGDRVRVPDGPEASDAPRRTARDFRLAGPGGVDIVPASEIELPDFPLDRRTHADTPRESLRSFSPERAGLPATTLDEAPAHIRDNLTERPWLRSAENAPPEVQRVFAALDRGLGHATERHEGEVSSEELRSRVTRLEDPAQLDQGKRERSTDAFKRGVHACDFKATQIWDPDAFATTFARGVNEPRVRAALERPFDVGAVPREIDIPISDLLGNDGHQYCAGFQLVEVGDRFDAAMDCRMAWVDARRGEREPDVPEPRCVPIETFEGGTIKFRFRPNEKMDGYEVSTMYPEPPGGGVEGTSG